MAKFIILNFEDADDNFDQGNIRAHVTRKRNNRDAPVLPANVLGSARDTVAGVINKAKTKETMFGKNHVHHYSCVELIAADKAGTLNRADVANIREDISTASNIIIIMHGKPDDTEQGFANHNQPAATWRELGRLALLLFPLRDKIYHISLVMCYGARTSDIRRNHVGQVPPGLLASSFAYKFFRSICVSRNVNLVACTGAVSTTAADGTNAVESEEWVRATLDIIDYKKDAPARAVKKAQLDELKNSYITQDHGTQEQWEQLMNDFYGDRDKQAANDYERAIKRYIGETAHHYAQLQAAKSQAAQMHGGKSNLDKYGRIRYIYDGPGRLTIINKYGDPGDPNVGEDYTLYSGPLL